MKIRLLSIVLVFLGVAFSYAAAGASDMDASLSQWRALHGSNWQVETSTETGFTSFLYGGRAAAAMAPRDESETTETARVFVEETRALHGIDSSTLVARQVTFLALSHLGSADKWTVRFQQVVDGVRVTDGWVNVLMDVEGALLSIQTTGLPELEGFPIIPAISRAVAARAALAAFSSELGTAPIAVQGLELVIAQLPLGGQTMPRLAWEIDVRQHIGGVPEGRTYWIGAHDGSVLRSSPNVHRARHTVQGTQPVGASGANVNPGASDSSRLVAPNAAASTAQARVVSQVRSPAPPLLAPGVSTEVLVRIPGARITADSRPMEVYDWSVGRECWQVSYRGVTQHILR